MMPGTVWTVARNLQVFSEHVVISFSNIIFAASGKDTLQGALFVHIQDKEIRKGEREGASFSTNVKSLGLLVEFFICDEGSLGCAQGWVPNVGQDYSHPLLRYM